MKLNHLFIKKKKRKKIPIYRSRTAEETTNIQINFSFPSISLLTFLVLVSLTMAWLYRQFVKNCVICLITNCQVGVFTLQKKHVHFNDINGTGMFV